MTLRRTQPPPGIPFAKPARGDYDAQLPWRCACLVELRRAWKEYDKEHPRLK